MAWTEDRVERLKKLWGDGQSASQIAKELGGVTRNAVIGKVHRLGLSNRASASPAIKAPRAQAKEKPSPNPVAAPQVKSANAAAPAPEVQAKPVKGPAHLHIVSADQRLPPQPSAHEISPDALASHQEIRKKALRLGLMELTERTCKWPFGDPATDDFWFCGLPVEPGKCYCEPCAKVAYQPPSTRRERRR